MTSTATTPEQYLSELPEDRQETMRTLHETILANLPEGFSPSMQYGMISYVVPHGRYPAGYHCDPKQALPFISIASQKNFIALYHMGVYANPELMEWVQAEYPKHCKGKLDMGKSCIRFKPAQVPMTMIGELVGKMSVDAWIALYESALKR
jgi:hypothetical protein